MTKIQLEVGKHYVEIHDDGVVLIYTEGMITNCVPSPLAVVIKALVGELQEANDKIHKLESKVEDLERESMGDNW